MQTLGILCSGALGLDTLSQIVDNHTVNFVLTDSKSDGIINLALKHNIPFFAGNPRKGKGYNFVREFNVDVLISVNYLFLIENDIIEHSNILTFNIHGSLLPKYRGRTPHVWAIINGETKAGITAHVIDEGCDTGKIIHQIEIPISIDDTGATMLEKYSAKYYSLVEKVLMDISDNQLNLKLQIERDATYFGKRTPDDGEIDWDWKKEDIRNWVRAQAYPYPGAYSYYSNRKIIIDKVSILEFEGSTKFSNGKILEVTPNVVVKASNGLVILDEIRTIKLNFKKGKLFENENRQ